jgi:hypothetical protein
LARQARPALVDTQDLLATTATTVRTAKMARTVLLARPASGDAMAQQASVEAMAQQALAAAVVQRGPQDRLARMAQTALRDNVGSKDSQDSKESLACPGLAFQELRALLAQQDRRDRQENLAKMATMEALVQQARVALSERLDLLGLEVLERSDRLEQSGSVVPLVHPVQLAS